MENLESTQPTQDERIMAALSHVTALIPLMGVIAPIIIWATQKEKSKYVSFQALQALVYQIVNVVVMILGYGCYFASFFAALIAMPLLDSMADVEMVEFSLLFVIFPISVMILFGVLELFFILYGIVAAVFVLQGKPFKYLVIGKRLERYLQKRMEAPSPTAE
jgi:uncharacterized Tic20 family protein